MKIGILTFHWADNFGAVLQCYALQEWLKKNLNNLCSVEIVNFIPPQISGIYEPFYYEKSSAFSNIKNFLRCLKNYDNWKNRRACFNSFRSRMTISAEISEAELLNSGDLYDFWITGSDQVWNTDIVGDYFKIYDLSFATSYKISYAASSGNLDNYRHAELINDISRLNNISVRENSTSEFLTDVLGSKVFNVMDPTFLLSKDAWEELSDYQNIRKPYVFLYCISYDDELIQTIKFIKQKFDFDILSFSQVKELKGIITIVDKNSPEMFLSLIRNAEFVVASSFHATAFSIIFEKQFISFIPSYASNRVMDLCKYLGLEDKIVSDFKTAMKTFENQIDYNVVRERLDDKIDYSEKYLKDSFNDFLDIH